jgi:general secretion pathway protein D
MRDADIRAFISDISSLTGKTFIVDPRINAKVTIISREDLSIEEAYEVMLSVLAVHGYSAIEQDNATKIVPEITGRQAFNTFSRPNSPSDKLVTDIIRPKFAAVNSLISILRPIMSTQGHIAVYEPTNSLIIADRAGNVKKLTAIINELDKTPGETYEIIKLSYSSSKEVSKIIDKIFNENSGGMNPNQFTSYSIDRINSILLVGDIPIVNRMKNLIQNLDTEQTSSSTLKVKYLKYADAKSLEKILKNLSENLSGDKSKSKIMTSIEAHEGTNSLVISADPEVMMALEDVISNLDIKRAQVLVEAIIVEISDTLAKELGVQILFTGEGSNTPIISQRFGNPNPDLTAIVGGEVYNTTSGSSSLPAAAQSLLTLDGFAAGVGKYKKDKESFAAILNVLRKDTDSNVLSTPSILTMDNEESSIIVGQEIPITTGESLGTDNSNPFRTVSREEVGVKLLVKPQINEGNSIRLDIEQEVSSVYGPLLIGASEIATNKREIKTVVMVEDTEIIVLGGLISDDVQESERKVPLLGDIPLLGRLFKSTTTSRSKKNLVVFLKPTIVRDVADMQLITNKKYNLLKAEQLLKTERGRPTPDLKVLEDLISEKDK